MNLSDLFKIETTTSFKLDRDENGNDVDPPELTLNPIYRIEDGSPAGGLQSARSIL